MDFAELVIRGLAIGLGATLITDAITLGRQGWAATHGFYRLAGRWVGSIPRTGFVHDDIRSTPPVTAEAVLGWSAHFFLGAVFGVGFVLACGTGSITLASAWSALSFGLITLLVPWLIFQPLYGWGLAVSNLPNRRRLRLRSIVTHLTFGLGLWVCAVALNLMF